MRYSRQPETQTETTELKPSASLLYYASNIGLWYLVIVFKLQVENLV